MSSKFRSGLERQVAELLKRFEVKFEYETLKVPYVIDHIYNPDFILSNGVVLETKGLFDAEDRRKILAVLKQNPTLNLKMVFQNPNQKISKKSKTSYANWCDKHSVEWCSYASIPIEWLKPNK